MLSSNVVTNPIFNLLHFLVLTYFSNNYCTVIYYDRNLSDRNNVCNSYCEYSRLLEHVFATEQLLTVWITSGTDREENLMKAVVEVGCQSYITVTENLTSFLEMKLLVKDISTQRMRDRNFLIISENVPSLADAWITREALKFYPNLWFMFLSSGQELKFYTQNFASFDDLNLYHVNSFNLTDSTFTSTVSLFYDKIINLGGRAVEVGVTDYLPYCKTEYVGSGKGNADAYGSVLSKELRIEGMDGRVLVEFCKLRNCELKLQRYGANGWGEIYQNGSGYGMLYATYTKETEFATCVVSYSWVSNFLDGSHSIGLSSVGLLVPRAKLLPTFFTPKYPFSSVLWLIILVTLIAIIVIYHIIVTLNAILSNSNNSPAFGRSTMDMISIYLDQGIFSVFTSSSYRIFICIILLTGVVLSNSYSGGLASVLTIPRYEDSLETIADFANSPFLWGATAMAWVLSVEDAESVDVQQTVKKFVMVPDLEQLYQRTLSGDFAIGIEVVASQKINVGTYIREDNVHLFEALREMLYADYTQGVSQRGWPLMDHFNKFVLEAAQHGLTLHWERRTLRKYQSSHLAAALEQIFAGTKPIQELRPLTVEHVLGGLVLLGTGVAMATGAFVLEILCHAISHQIS